MNGQEAREEFDKKQREIEEKKIKQNQIKEKEQKKNLKQKSYQLIMSKLKKHSQN